MYALTLLVHLVLQDVFRQQSISGLNVADKALIHVYEMPLTFALGVLEPELWIYYTHSSSIKLSKDYIAKQTNHFSAQSNLCH